MTAEAAAQTPADDFEASYPDLVRYLARHCGARDTALDLAHDLWLRLADAAPPPAPEHARAYLFAAARHIAIDHARRGRHRAEALADAATRQAGVTPDVADHVAHRQALDAVARALQALPARTRDAFLAHRLEGTGHAELALQHGVTRSTIERDVQRARARVEAAVEHWHGGLPQQPGRRRTLAALLGTAGVVLTAPVLWHAWHLWHTRVPGWQQALATPHGRIARHALPDGSTLTLDADSAIEAAYFGNRREVHLLRGSAFFAVARDPQRPFSVRAGAALVTVLGTRFEVALHGEALRPGASVTVESGRVRVTPRDGAAPIDLQAGEALRIAPDGAARRQARLAGTATVAAWRDGWLSFSGMPLAEAAQRISRYRRQPVQVAPEVAALAVSGEVRIAQADEWLRLLPRLLPVQVRAGADGALNVLPRRH